MPHYRFYRLDRDNRIFGREEFDLDNDSDALVCAMELAHDFAIEVWERDRKIAFIARPSQPFGTEIQQRKSEKIPSHER